MTYNIDEVINELKTLSIDTPKKPILPDDRLIDEYEQRIGFVFSDDYRKFLKEASDVFVGLLSPLIITKKGDASGELSEALLDARGAGIPNDWLPICEDNGDYYCLTNDGSVRFWSHDGSSKERWVDLATWIKEVWIEEN